MNTTPHHSQNRPLSPSLEPQQVVQAELHKLLVEWNDTQADYPKEQSIPQLFEIQVERTPERVALVFDGQELSYRELNTQANQLAHHLQTLGVGPEVLVGISVERSLKMIVGILGILKAGGAYVPLDPTYPQERLEFMIQDSQITILLTQQRFIAQLPQQIAHIISLDSDWPIIALHPETNLSSDIASENIAYVIYTSGSTGKPKGVLGTHRASINRFTWMWKTYPFTPDEACCQKTTLSFVDAVWEIFGPLLQGIRLVIIPDLVVKDAALFLQILAQHTVTRIVLVPSLLRFLLDSGGPTMKKHLSSLKYWVSSGEALPLELVWRFQHYMPQATLINLYGSSEVAADATFYEIKPGQQPTNVPIGRPIANSQVYLLDQAMQLVPIGMLGELYIGGDGLARGYLNRPELTDERFIPDPFRQTPGARLYKTGDLAHYEPDGTLIFLGRIDHQVKIRGMRVELGEIEAILHQHPTIQDVVVVAREDTPDEKRLVAYVVFHKGQNATMKDLLQHMRSTLPAYMIPSAFVWLDALPLTPSGKIDRLALPPPDPVRQDSEEPFVAPITTIHYQLQQVWEDLLNVRPIGIHDNFFYIGGHSLLATRLIERIEQVSGKRLSPATLFAGPTIAALAEALQTTEEKNGRAPIVAVQAQGTRRPFFYLHGAWNSGAFYCFQLAQHLGPDQPFYALAPYNFDGLESIPTVEEMAIAHIQTMRTIQPEGPYLLGGFCNGGLVAYEMARQLHAQGQQIDLLALIEPAFPPRLHALATSLIQHTNKLFRRSKDQQLESFLRLRHFYKYVRRERKTEDLDAFRSIDPSISTLNPTFDALRQDDHALLDWIITDYTYQPYPGKITLIWPQEEPFYGVWQRKATQEQACDLQFVPGTHIGCRTDHILSLAETLKRSVEQAQPALAGETSANGERIAVI
jgi:amino acid adenylation domain-containing protein